MCDEEPGLAGWGFQNPLSVSPTIGVFHSALLYTRLEEWSWLAFQKQWRRWTNNLILLRWERKAIRAGNNRSLNWRHPKVQFPLLRKGSPHWLFCPTHGSLFFCNSSPSTRLENVVCLIHKRAASVSTTPHAQVDQSELPVLTISLHYRLQARSRLQQPTPPSTTVMKGKAKALIFLAYWENFSGKVPGFYWNLVFLGEFFFVFDLKPIPIPKFGWKIESRFPAIRRTWKPMKATWKAPW